MRLFLIEYAKIISEIKLKECIISIYIHDIIIKKFCYKKKLYFIIFFKANKNLKINFHYNNL